MIYKFKILSNENKNFIRKIAIDAENTFESLHVAIQECTGFDSDQLASFFIPGQKWKKRTEITLLNMGIDQGSALVMNQTILKDFITTEGQTFNYEYDFFMDRSFIIKLIQIINNKNLMEPECTLSKGEAPQQIIDDEEELSSNAQNDGNPELKNIVDFGDLEDYSLIYGDIDE